VANQIMPEWSGPIGAYALVGMGAVVAGATHAPLTAILIIFELTYDYALIVPLMAACILSTLVTTRLDKANIYTHKLLRRGIDLSAGREVNVLRSLRVHEVMDEHAATVQPSTHLGEIVDAATRDGITYFYVTDDDDRLVGAIGTPEMRNALVDAGTLRDLVIAADLARADVPVVTPEDDLDRVMRIFGGKNREELPVVTDLESRRFLGTVTRAHLLEAYHRELMKRDMVAELAGGLSSSEADAIHLGEDHWMKQVDVPGSFVGRSLRELDVRRTLGVQIVMLRRRRDGSLTDQWVEMVPGPDTELQLGDMVVAVGPRDAVQRLGEQ
jgi:CIC family chloride channel protein